MKNGSRFSRLTLAESGLDTEAGSDNDSRLFFVLLTVSISCAAASVATGSYAVWLARQQAARQALTDVNDILRSCQSRMSELESVLQRLPSS